jgi:hypothetical protein
MNLESELREAGCEMDAEVFRDVVQEVKAVLFPTWSDEEMLRHPETHVPEYLWEVRRRCECRNLRDYVILGTLQNCRKGSRGADAA